MTGISEYQDRHFIGISGQMFWINGPEDCCYFSEQKQWRSGLSFREVLEWKQCAPTGRVSQRFSSIAEALKAFENNSLSWSYDAELRRIGDQMVIHRSLKNYRPTYIKMAEAKGAPVRTPPWLNGVDWINSAFRGPRCLWPGPAKYSRKHL